MLTATLPHPLSHRESRAKIETEITLDSESNFYAGFEDSGLFLATYCVYPVGTEVNLSLALPDSKQAHEVSGKVRWVREFNPTMPNQTPGMAIQFCEVPAVAQQKIAAFQDRREPLFYD